MLYTGEVLDANTALACGLVDAVHPPDELLDAAVTLAQAVGKRSWRALELTKLSLRQHRRSTTSIDIVAQALLFDSNEKQLRMQKYLNKL
jgi:enoyl-CoA hydratase/carnithine racemase